MGLSSSISIDNSDFHIFSGKTEAAIKNFSPYYSRQYSVAFCNHVRSEVEQQRDLTSQFLKTKPPLEPGTVLYEAELSQFAEDIKKWKDRYVVVKNDFVVESYENKEAYQRGAAPKSRILPASGKVLTSEEEYNLLSDKHFPDPLDFSCSGSRPFVLLSLPRPFSIFLLDPYERDCHFKRREMDQTLKAHYISMISSCLKHKNTNYKKQTTFEAQAFLEAVQFFRQEKGHYGSWDMLTGGEIQVLSNLVMEELLPTLQTDLLPKMKGKKNDRKRAWLSLLEEAYNLVQHQVSEGLSALKEECRTLTKGLEGTIRSDMDQIVNSKNFLIGKIKAVVAQPAEKSCMESVQPFLASILEELMGPVSSGFSEVRALFEKEVDELSQSFQTSKDSAQLKEHLDRLMNLPLDSVKMEACYSKVDLLEERLQDLKSRFRFPHVDLVVQRTQNYMQELMENAAFTFEQLLSPHLQGEASKTAVAIEKVKLRVLKQYDYDSSTIRKKIFQEALVEITLPTLQKALASTCKPELQKYEQFIFADHTNMIHVENVYEEILHQILLGETLKVIKEAASLKKHNLFEDNMALPSESVSSLTDLKIPTGSNQASPAKRASGLLPGVLGSETLNNEVFQESEEKQQPVVPSPLARRESLSLPDPSPPPGGDEQVIISRMEDPTVSPVAAEDTAGLMGTPAAELEFGGTPRDEDPTHEEPKSVSASGSLDELRKLLTETVEVPVESALATEKDTKEGTLSPQENEKEEEKAHICTEAQQAAASPLDNCEESEASEGKAHPPPLEAEAGGEEVGELPEVSGPASEPSYGGLPKAHCPGPTEQPEEPGEPVEAREPVEAIEAEEVTQEGREAECTVQGELMLQEDCIVGSDPACPSESRVSEEQEPVGEKNSPGKVGASTNKQEMKAARVHECQWVVENVPNTEVLASHTDDDSSPDQPLEE
uniref:Niban apoptosis regulator 1 n=1 Tax=Otolemur garnettii TaxID=30611 RepID=H0XEU1_OTOGA